MPTSRNKKQVHIPRDVVERFENRYPKVKEIYISRALELGLQDKDIFELIFFNPRFMEVR